MLVHRIDSSGASDILRLALKTDPARRRHESTSAEGKSTDFKAYALSAGDNPQLQRDRKTIQRTTINVPKQLLGVTPAVVSRRLAARNCAEFIDTTTAIFASAEIPHF